MLVIEWEIDEQRIKFIKYVTLDVLCTSEILQIHTDRKKAIEPAHYVLESIFIVRLRKKVKTDWINFFLRDRTWLISLQFNFLRRVVQSGTLVPLS